MYKPPFRFWIAALVFYTTFTLYSFRINLSIGIIDMAGRTQKTPYCSEENQERSSSEKQFDWDEDTQAHLLAAYSYGYSISGIPGGYLAENFGPYNSLIVLNILQIVFNSLSVWNLDIYSHWVVLFVTRLFLGVLGGMIYPATQVLICKWAPPSERGRFSICLRGNVLGTAITFPVVGAVTQAFGWRWGIHVTSLMCVLYIFIFWLVGGNDPQKHKWVTNEEKEYIITAQMGSVSFSNIRKVPPYKAIFTSIHFWALAIAHFGNGWGIYLLMTGLAKFLKETLGFNLRNSGFLAAAPYLLSLAVSFCCGAIADYAIHRTTVRKTIIRKLFIIVSHIISGISLSLLILIGCDDTVIAILLLTLGQGANGASVVTNLQNAQDLAPNFAGSIYGIINTFAGLNGVFTPMLTAALIDEYGGLKGYKLSFFIGGLVYMSTGTFFMLFGTSETQSWNEIAE